MISISKLGKSGRFGNQLFQYIFAKRISELNGVQLSTPQWIGQEIFENINETDLGEAKINMPWDEFSLKGKSYNLQGYFQAQRHVDLWSREYAKSIFKIKPEIKELLWTPKTPYITCHRRLGDYASTYNNHFCIVSKESYQAKLQELNLDYEVIWVSEESPNRNDKLPASLEFLQDFWILMNADILLRGNSTFSWWAGALGTPKIFSPLVKNLTGHQDVSFVEGNWPAMVWQPPNHGDIYLNER